MIACCLFFTTLFASFPEPQLIPTPTISVVSTSAIVASSGSKSPPQRLSIQRVVRDIIDTLAPPNIYIGGDVMLSRSVGAALKSGGIEHITSGYHPFAGARMGSFVLLNLESPFSLPDKDERKPTFFFGANPRSVEVLKWLGQDQMVVVSLANNHILNASYTGLALTMDTLSRAGIGYVGLGKNAKPDFYSLQRGARLYCIGGYSYDGRSYYDKKTKTTWYVNHLNDSLKDLEHMQKAGCEVRVFMMHWGAEYRRSPPKSQADLAHKLIDGGADLIVGAHSHIFGLTEEYKGKMIYYSLGNFIFDQNWGKNGCQKSMDCVTDPRGKKVVPTHVGTAVELKYPYQTGSLWRWEIYDGRMTSY